MSIPDWKLERVLGGDAPEALQAEVEAAMATDASVQERMARLQASNEEILRLYPPRVVAAAVEQRAHRERSRSVVWVPALALAATLLVVVALPEAPPEDPEAAEVFRAKGERAQLFVHIQTEGEPVRLDDGAVARAGDVLQLSFTRGSDRHGLLFSIDGRGAVTVHLPSLPAAEGSGAQVLDFAYELDDAPRFERFFLVTAPEPFESAAVLRAAEDLAGAPDADQAVLDLPAALHQTTLVLRKE